jgi:catechol 2,3-dioxygenase-like lactoylglutathione lyase family enzyme
MPVVFATAFDHLVLQCADVERTLAWYLDRLGLSPVRVDEWRRGEAPFPSVRVDETTIIDLIPGPGDPAESGVGTGSRDGRLDHICLVIEPIDLADVAASGAFDVLEGPVRRFGARGDGTSLYVRDPDGLVVELRHYG